MKQLGLQFVDADRSFIDKVHNFMTRLVSYYRRTDPSFTVEVNQVRGTYRVPVDVELPEDLIFEAWLVGVKRNIKCRVRDLSAGGVNLIPPLSSQFEEGKILKILFVIDGKEYKCKCEIRNVADFKPSTAHKQFLKKNYYDAIYRGRR